MVAPCVLIMERYPCQLVSENEYRFTTDHGNVYAVSFAAYWQQDVINFIAEDNVEIYELYFGVVSTKQHVFDKRIAVTIISLMEEFLMQGKRAVFYITDRNDDRSLELFRLYFSWFALHKRLNKNSKTLKVDKVVKYKFHIEAYVSCVLIDKNDRYAPNELSELVEVVLREIYPNSTVWDWKRFVDNRK